MNIGIRKQLEQHRKRGRFRAFVLAFLIHGALAAFLFLGIRWKTQEPAPVQVELVNAPERTESATAAPAVPPEPRPEPKPELRPDTRPEPKAEHRAEPKPDLATEQLKKEAQLKAARERELNQRELKERELNDKELKQREVKQREAKAAEAKAAEAKAAEEKREALQQQRIRQLQQQAGVSREATEGSKSGTVDADYEGRLRAIISRNTVFNADDTIGNPVTMFAVELNPDCSLKAVRMTRSSGNLSWDQAAERAIRKTDPFPKPRDGHCPGRIDQLTHRPKGLG